jgi:hypothetical protein
MVFSLAGIEAIPSEGTQPSQGTRLSYCTSHGLVASDSLGIQRSWFDKIIKKELKMFPANASRRKGL